MSEAIEHCCEEAENADGYLRENNELLDILVFLLIGLDAERHDYAVELTARPTAYKKTYAAELVARIRTELDKAAKDRVAMAERIDRHWRYHGCDACDCIKDLIREGFLPVPERIRAQREEMFQRAREEEALTPDTSSVLDTQEEK